MRKRNKINKNHIIIGLILILCIMVIGYAAFASSLKISGTSTISTAWDVEITGITTSNKIGGATVSGTPSYDKLTASFSTDLVSPGDSITYNIKVENKGSLDTKLNKITLNKTDNPAIIFSLSGLKEGGILNKGESTTLNVMITYSNGVTTQPNNLEASLTVNLDFIQSDGASNTQITTKGKSIEDLKALTTSMGDGLYMDSTENDRYVYRGADPNNYITLGTDTYRIIAIESDGTLKVIRNGSIGNKVFDPGYSTSIAGVTNSNSTDGTRYSNVSTNYCYDSLDSNYYGCNVWGSKTTMLDSSGKNITKMSWEVGGTLKDLPEKEAYVNTYLNNDWYNSLNAEIKNIITTHLFNVGVINKDETSLSNTVTQEKAYKWRGKVGLINPNDYVKASTNSACTSVNAYFNTSSCYSNSEKHNWIFNTRGSSFWLWTIAPTSNMNARYVFNVFSFGPLNGNSTYSNGGVAPVFYLSSNISLDGKGTINNPYIVTN